MHARNQWNRATGVVLGAIGVLLIVFFIVGLAPAAIRAGDTDAHIAGDASMALMIFGPVFVVVALFTLACAWSLWRGMRGAAALGAIWVAAAGLYVMSALSGYGNALWMIQVAVLDSARLSVRWPYVYSDPYPDANEIGTPPASFPSARLDDLLFWLPAVVVIGAIVVAVLLLAGWIHSMRTDRRASVDLEH